MKLSNLIGAEIIKAGLSREEAAKYLKDVLGDELKKTNNYWELLAEHIVTRAREFGKTSAYEKAGVEYVKIVAVMDNQQADLQIPQRKNNSTRQVD